MNSKILIVGGSGFIGKNLIFNILKSNIKYDIFSLSLKQKIRIPGVNNINVDLRNFTRVKKILNKIEFKYVINVSGYVDHITDHKIGEKFLIDNLRSIFNLIKVLKRSKLKRFIHIGSGDEYDIDNKKLDELTKEKAKNYYSLSKIYTTHYLKLYYELESFPVVFFRVFLVYGPHQKNNRLIPFVIENCLKNKLSKLSKGNQKRDFLYIDDLIRAIIISLKVDNINGLVFNICSGNSHQVSEIVKIINKKINSGSFEFDSYKRKYNEPKIILGDNYFAQKKLKWKPAVNLSDGLDKTINYYKKKIHVKS